MLIASRNAELRAAVNGWHAEGKRVGLVPTMGSLHAGHLALVDKSLALVDKTVVSIFVNPTQFVDGEDLETYPRTLEQDRQALSDSGVDLLYVPDQQALYPNGTDNQIRVEAPALDNILCGAFRPGHFTGVATVVTKLFNLAQPDVAVFGDKDYQQLLIIRRLAQELHIPIEIVSVPTVREPDGLAMSSRNGYLSVAERKIAPGLFRVLNKFAKGIARGANGISAMQQEGLGELDSLGFRPEYFSVRRAQDLAKPGELDRDLVLMAAAWLGRTRLIDHVAVQRSIR